MPTLIIDNKAYEVSEGKNLLEAILSLGLDLPYFCWHPKLGSVGACRQCAIKQFKDKDDEKGKIVMACMEPVSDGAILSLEDPEVKKFRAMVIEGLMTNHPHDCPTCDEGGECHLQDMTVMSGHNYRRYRFNKRTFNNQYLGPFLNHEMNRCITCYRCVRFYKDYAGGNDLNAYASHNHVYFGRDKDGVLENEFSGNLVEVCPTGVFTDKTLKQHYTRKWDLTNSPSICNHCSLGCNTILGERNGKVRRTLSRYNQEVNGYFLCNRGRFGYEYMNSDKRIRWPKQKTGQDEFQEVSIQEMLNRLKNDIQSSKKIIGIGSPAASVESNYALKKYVGEENFYSGMDDNGHELTMLAFDIMKTTPARISTLSEIERADAILVLGEDLINTAPMMALALRQAVRQNPMKKAGKLGIPEWNDTAVRDLLQDEKGPFYQAQAAPTKLDNLATDTYLAAPDDIARFGQAVAHALDTAFPNPENLPKEIQNKAKKVAEALQQAEKPLVITGVSLKNRHILEATANILTALTPKNNKAAFSCVFPEANQLGMAMLDGRKLSEAVHVIAENNDTIVLCLENDLFRQEDKENVNTLMEKAGKLVVFDMLESDFAEKANYIIPVATPSESTGTLVNNEGRTQRFYQTYVPKEKAIQPAWRWMQAISVETGIGDLRELETLQELLGMLVRDYPEFNGINKLSPPPDYRVVGQKIPRQSHRYSGRTALHTNISIHEPEPPEDPDTPLSFTMEGFRGENPLPDKSFFWSPGWNSAQSINKFQIETGGALHGGNPGIRLIDALKTPHEHGYYKPIPQKFSPSGTTKILIVPGYHIYGSARLSSCAPAIASQIPKAMLQVNPESLSDDDINDGEQILLKINNQEFKPVIKLLSELPKGIGVLSIGLEEIPFVDASQSGTIKKIS